MANNQNLKPFEKGDARINRKGRPKNFDQLRKLAQEILHEAALGKDGQPSVKDGHVVTNAELILRSWVADKKKQQQLLEVAYGKVPTPIEGGDEGKPIQVVIKYANDNA